MHIYNILIINIYIDFTCFYFPLFYIHWLMGNILRDHFREYGAQYMEQIENAQKVRL